MQDTDTPEMLSSTQQGPNAIIVFWKTWFRSIGYPLQAWMEPSYKDFDVLNAVHYISRHFLFTNSYRTIFEN
jgi:hypothetical protein